MITRRDGATFDPWDALDLLDAFCLDGRWRGFLRDCSLLLLPMLPPEAESWVIAADEFETGTRTLESLTLARVEAWHFHNARQSTSPQAELSGIRAVMYRLWPDEGDWSMSSNSFLHFITEAGLTEEQWWPLLQARFPDVLEA